jgi:integrase
MGNLRTRQCETLKCPSTKKMVNHYDGDGLYFRITNKGSKSWLYFFTWNKKRNLMSIGSYPNPYSLALARQERDKLKKILAEGRNPKIARDMKKEEVVGASLQTIEHLYKAVVKERTNSKRNAWSENHSSRTAYTWKHLEPIAKVPITELTKKRLRDLLVSINQRIGASTGDKCKALMSSIYSHAVANDIVQNNLVSSFAKDPELKKRSADEIAQQPSITYDRLGETFTLINDGDMTIVNKYALFCLQYTSLRVGSLLSNRWENYDQAKKLLRINKEFVKNKKAINCPVIKEMADMFETLKKIQQKVNNTWDKKCFIFSTDGKHHINVESPNKALKRLILTHKLGFRAVPHGMRQATETEWIKANFLTTAINVQQDHKSTTGDAVRDRYISKDEDFFDERTKMLEHMAKLIKDAMSDYEHLQRAINNAKGSSPIMATSDTIDAT